MSWMAWPCHDRGGWNPPDPWGMVWRWGVTFTDHESDSHSSQEAWRSRTSLSSSDKEIKVASLYCWAAQPHFPPIRSTRSSAPHNYRENTDTEDVSSPWNRPLPNMAVTWNTPNARPKNVWCRMKLWYKAGRGFNHSAKGTGQILCRASKLSRETNKKNYEPRSPALQADSLPAEPQGKPKSTGEGSLSLLGGGVFPTQGSNWVLLHCSQILYQLSYQGSPDNHF